MVENYLTGKQTVVNPLLIPLLNQLDRYVPRETIVEELTVMPREAELLDRLLEQDILVSEGSNADKKDKLVEETWKWRHDARYFHYSTQHVPYEPDIQRQRASIAQLAREQPPPSPFKDYGRSDVKLSGAFGDRSDEFWNTLRRRRTIRTFERQPISEHALSNILLWTWGQTHRIDDPELGPYILKTSPSGGARHPIEVYPMVLRVDGVEPGIYHYSVKRHELEALRLGMFEDMAVRLLANQPWVRDASVVFVMTGVLSRCMWKYRHSHAYRVLLLDAGHLGQTFHLVCTKLGLAPFTSSAKHDEEIEAELGIDSVAEISLYAAATGLAARSTESRY